MEVPSPGFLQYCYCFTCQCNHCYSLQLTFLSFPLFLFYRSHYATPSPPLKPQVEEHVGMELNIALRGTMTASSAAEEDGTDEEELESGLQPTIESDLCGLTHDDDLSEEIEDTGTHEASGSSSTDMRSKDLDDVEYPTHEEDVPSEMEDDGIHEGSGRSSTDVRTGFDHDGDPTVDSLWDEGIRLQKRWLRCKHAIFSAVLKGHKNVGQTSHELNAPTEIQVFLFPFVLLFHSLRIHEDPICFYDVRVLCLNHLGFSF